VLFRSLLPEARIAVAHGQMPERELERVMREFTAQRFNLLLCSTIIETGIDVPTANTIVISRADKFGLAQLHQLRGRVGRSHHQAYAYLLVHDVEGLTKQAAQRLTAIQEMEELGSGFYLAMHDLEIRGAGEVLGDSQSGNMMEVGFQLYNEMLSEAVRALKNGQEPDLLSPNSAVFGGGVTEINLHAPAGRREALHGASGCPSERSTSRTNWARSRGSAISRSMRSLSLPTSLMCRFFCTSSMIFIASTGGLGRKLMFIRRGLASILITP
jgi:transcription-repair coupling factor (superfamily II helicase)